MTGRVEQPTEQPAYPIPRPTVGDARFTNGLTFDIAEVLARHGYPPLRTGADLVHLQQALFTLIYQPATSTDTSSGIEENL
jgi:hypothetical protein